MNAVCMVLLNWAVVRPLRVIVAETVTTAGGGDGGGGAGVMATGEAAAGGGAAAPHVLSPNNTAVGTPADAMAANCAVMHAPMTAVLLGDTPASTIGVAIAVRQEPHRFAGTAHGVTAAA